MSFCFDKICAYKCALKMCFLKKYFSLIFTNLYQQQNISIEKYCNTYYFPITT